MTAVLVVLALPQSGCVAILNTYNQPYDDFIRIQSSDPDKYSISVEADGGTTHTNANGTVGIHVPRLPRTCDTAILGVRITKRHGNDQDVVVLRNGNAIVKKLSINDIRKLEKDTNGARVVKLK